MGRLIVRAEADDDIDDVARFIAKDDLGAGKRFYDAVAHDLLLLADNPRIGARRRAVDPALKELRSWPVSGYRNYLIFYLAGDRGIDVLRVFHGARDVERLIKRIGRP
jgi:toxin ParE1/3/4